MSKQLADWQRADRAAKKGVAKDQPRPDGLNPQERRALWKMRAEAEENGATLASGGKGGLPPSLVLGVMRRDEWRCKRCGGSEDLSVHHKSEHMNDPKAQARSRLLGKQGKIDSPANLVTVCAKCHDAIHQKDREDYGGE